MDKLELVRRLARNCGDLRPIDRVEGAEGIVQLYSDWISDAWRDIQNKPGWRWMRGTAVAYLDSENDIVAPERMYDFDTGLPMSRFSAWREGRGTYLTAPTLSEVPDSELPLEDVVPPAKVRSVHPQEIYICLTSWDAWRAAYRVGSSFVGEPYAAAVMPDNRLAFAPTPAEGNVYRAKMDYWRGPQALEADDDSPDMPEQWHMLIVYDAMVRFGRARGRLNVEQEGRESALQVRSQLEASQGQSVALAGPLI